MSNHNFREEALTDTIVDNDSVTKLAKKLDIDNWFVCKLLGRGGFSKVLLVKRTNSDGTDCYFAMKCVRKSNIMAKRFIEGAVKEREILLTMKHPFLLSLHYAF